MQWLGAGLRDWERVASEELVWARGEGIWGRAVRPKREGGGWLTEGLTVGRWLG